MARNPAQTSALDKRRRDSNEPGAEVRTNNEKLDWISPSAVTAIHPIGTYRMGPNARDTLVNDRRRVHGVAGLRATDAAIMPTQVSDNTNAAIIMIGKKARDMIMQDHTGR